MEILRCMVVKTQSLEVFYIYVPEYRLDPDEIRPVDPHPGGNGKLKVTFQEL
jgi:hypothetical protein